MAASRLSEKTQNISTKNRVPASQASGPALQLVLCATAPCLVEGGGDGGGPRAGTSGTLGGEGGSSPGECSQKGPQCLCPRTVGRSGRRPLGGQLLGVAATEPARPHRPECQGSGHGAQSRPRSWGHPGCSEGQPAFPLRAPLTQARSTNQRRRLLTNPRRRETLLLRKPAHRQNRDLGRERSGSTEPTIQPAPGCPGHHVPGMLGRGVGDVESYTGCSLLRTGLSWCSGHCPAPTARTQPLPGENGAALTCVLPRPAALRQRVRT